MRPAREPLFANLVASVANRIAGLLGRLFDSLLGLLGGVVDFLTRPFGRTFGRFVMAAGQGTRMKSDLPKVLCPVLGRPMIDFVLSAAESLAAWPTSGDEEEAA